MADLLAADDVPEQRDQSVAPIAGAPFAMEDLLETPQHVFDDYRRQGVSQLVCEEKHMGSRAVVVVCRDLDAARERFGVDGELGAIVTRTGRRFFADWQLERAMLERLSDAVDELDWWDRFETEWICLDCELMPWSAKAQELLRTQYAAVAAAGRASLPAAVDALRRWRQREDVAAEEGAELLARLEASAGNVERFAQAYGHYCWSVDSLEDYRLAPFHLLATERAVHVGQDHPWHMETLDELCAVDPILQATAWREVDLNDPQSTLDAIQWWHALTAAGGEGMVVKPREFLGQAFQGSQGLGTPACPGESRSSQGLGTPACPGESRSSQGLGTPACPGESRSSQGESHGAKGLLQPAIKCRGPEYLRIIYGPDYNAPRNLQRLRRRQVGRKQSLALREFALGVEALERFVRREPLRRVHECVFGVLALESEPVDSRL